MDNAGPVSRAFLLWVDPMMWAGARRPLGADEALKLPRRLHPANLQQIFEQAWTTELAAAALKTKQDQNRQVLPSFVHVLWRILGDYIVRSMALQTFVVVMKCACVLQLRRLIQIVNADDDERRGEGLALSAGLMVCNFLDGMMGSLAAGQLQLALYGCLICWAQATLRKGSLLHPSVQGKHPRGTLVSLALSDLNRIVESSSILMYGLSAPVMLVFAFALMAFLLGPMVFVAILVSIVGTYAIHRAGKLQGASFRSKMAFQGKRLAVLNEMLQSVRFTKYYVLEEHYEAKMLDFREKEVSALRWMKMSLAFNWPIAACVPTGVSIMIFVLHILIHGDLPDKADTFAVLALSRFLYLPFAFFGTFLGGVGMFRAAGGRLRSLLLEPEVQYHSLPSALTSNGEASSIVPDRKSSPQYGVSICNKDFCWSPDTNATATLQSITVEVPRGQLWVIVGELGSGKSSLLAAILGGIDERGTRDHERSAVASGPSRTYVAQEPMVMNATLRENVIFSAQDVKDETLEAAYTAAALWPDLEVLPAGDQTEIGEKGLTLSGGQKARVALARAVVATKPGGLVLLDDPLAAVDAQVGAHLFEECIVDALSGATRLLVTNQLHFLDHVGVSQIVVMDAGKIVEQGTYTELLDDRESYFSRMVSAQGGKDRQEGRQSMRKSQAKPPVMQSLRNSLMPAPIDKRVSTNTLTTAEGKREGAVVWSTFRFYFKSLGGCHVFMMLAFCSWMFHWCEVLPDVTLALWQDDVFELSRDSYLWIWLAVAIVSLGLCLMSRISWSLATTKAAKQIHLRLLSRVIHCPTSFFDKTPSGRIMNRLGEDQALVDWTSALMLEVMCIVVCQALDQLSLVIISRPLVGPFVIFYACCFFAIREIHRRASRETIRWWMVTKSQVFNSFEEIVSGAPTIYAFGREAQFRARFEDALLANVQWLMSKDSSGLWAEQRLALVGAAVVGTLGAQMVLVPDVVNGSLSSIAIIYALQLGFTLKTISYFMVQVEGVFASVERIMEFSDNLEQEPAWHLPLDKKLEKDAWPNDQCELVFESVRVRYLQIMAPALDNLSLRLRAREKVGIVGRTGSGKSTIMGALFRLFPLEQGRILIGGVDTATIGINLLRKQITIVPQDPILFSGDLRKNLDPVGVRSDDELWQALKRCSMAEMVEGLEGQLAARVAEGGGNFSVGERQVLCLARALLRNARILCLDEATANVDPTNDQRIQQVLSKEIADCLVLTIAHRLHTVMHSDRVLVLELGRLAQLDTPANLLAQPGIFRDLANEAGISAAGIAAEKPLAHADAVAKPDPSKVLDLVTI